MKILWEDKTWQDFREIPEDAAALFVAASTEQHALHLPTGTDSFLGRAVAEMAAERAKRPVYLLPAFTYGFSAHQMDFPGSITLTQKTLASVIGEVAESVYASGFRRFAFLISHGGNSAAVQFAVNELGQRHRDAVYASFCYWDFIKDRIAEIRETEMGGMGHAGELETSLMMYFHPETVREEPGVYRLAEGNRWYHPDMFAANKVRTYRRFYDISEYGNVGVSESASAEKGRKIAEAAADEIADFLDHFFE